MKPRFMALAALACCTLHAQAQSTGTAVQVYGSLTAAVVHKNHQSGGGSLTEQGNSLLAASYIGLRGSEDLGGGMSAVYRLESPLAIDTGNAGTTVGGSTKFWARQSFVGLNVHPAVAITLGRQFHAATDRVIRSLDVYNVAGTSLHSTPLALLGVNRYAGNDGRVDDSLKLRVTGPMGLQGGASVGGDQGASRSWSAELAQVTDLYAVAAWAAEFKAATAIAATGVKPANPVWGAGGNVRLGPVRVYLHLMRSELGTTVVNRPAQKNRFAHLGAAWQPVERVVVKAAWNSDQGTAINNVAGRDGRKNTLVASGEYFFSPRVSAHLAITDNRFSGGYKLDPVNIAGLGRDANASSTRSFSGGMRIDF